MKILYSILFLSLTLFARENPFFPSKEGQDISYTSNVAQNLPPLKQASITLPSSARVLTRVTVEYKNLDGSVATQTIELDNSIDWHLPLFLSQSYKDVKQALPKEKKRIKTHPLIKIASLKYATFYVKNRMLKIVTKDKILRDFLLTSPHRIVIDFKRDASFRSYEKATNEKIFKNIKIGNHNGYYRVVIELDGLYRYRSSKTKEGYIFKLY